MQRDLQITGQTCVLATDLNSHYKCVCSLRGLHWQWQDNFLAGVSGCEETNQNLAEATQHGHETLLTVTGQCPDPYFSMVITALNKHKAHTNVSSFLSCDLQTTGTYVSLPESSGLFFCGGCCKVSNCWVTSSAHLQFTNSCRCKGALEHACAYTS